MQAYVNGEFVDLESGTIGIHDAGFQHAVGVFETMRAYKGHVFRLGDHIQRLINSAKELGLTNQLHPGPLCELVDLALEKNELQEARVRLTVTGGDLSLLATAKQKALGNQSNDMQHHPSVVIVVTPSTVYPDEMFEKGSRVVIADAKANPFDPMAGHKTLNYWARLRSLTEAAAAGAGEALWFSVTNHLCGGAVSNAFVVKDDQLLTPIAHGEELQGAICSPVLPGITRMAVIDVARDALGIDTAKQMLSITDVLEADEVFLTNSSWQILPVVAVENEPIGDGQPGAVTKQLMKALDEHIASECDD